MPTQSLFLPQTIADDAAFRAWGQGIGDAMVACGLVRQNDSGHIDWTTVAQPLQGGNAGWEIFRFNDGLQTTAPIFIKVEWGTSSNGVSGKQMWITLGAGTDGAGTLTGWMSDRLDLDTGNNSGRTVQQTLVCGDTNRILVFQDIGAGVSFGIAFAVERTHNAAGGDTALGVNVTTHAQTAFDHIYCSWAFGQISAETAAGALVPSTGSGSIGSQTMVFPIFPPAGPYLNPLMSLMVVFAANVTAGVPFQVGHYGASRTFLPLSTVTYTPKVRGAVAGLTYLVRWE